MLVACSTSVVSSGTDKDGRLRPKSENSRSKDGVEVMSGGIFRERDKEVTRVGELEEQR
jgi:hypothetical protein